MRHVATLTIIAMMSACSGCATVRQAVPAHSQVDACQVVERYTAPERLARPCEYADVLAACIDLPPRDRLRIQERCLAELRK